jgi:hypothetical protein
MTTPSQAVSSQDVRNLLGKRYDTVVAFIKLLQQTKHAMLLVAVAERRADDDVAQQRWTAAEAQQRCAYIKYALRRTGNVDSDKPFDGRRDAQLRLAQDLKELCFLLSYHSRISGVPQLREIARHEDIFMPLGALIDLLRRS